MLSYSRVYLSGSAPDLPLILQHKEHFLKQPLGRGCVVWGGRRRLDSRRLVLPEGLVRAAPACYKSLRELRNEVNLGY